MPLSEYEQRVLAQMERQLSSDDPKLAQTFSGGPRRTSRVVLGCLIVLAGLGMLVGGVAQHMTWLGILGFLAMFGGVLVAMSRGRGAPAGARPTGGRAQDPRSRPRARRSCPSWTTVGTGAAIRVADPPPPAPPHRSTGVLHLAPPEPPPHSPKPRTAQRSGASSCPGCVAGLVDALPATKTLHLTPPPLTCNDAIESAACRHLTPQLWSEVE
ncbi:DUF3040 domain-containing protein [Serinibacter arcticus]|uniref:DUF3040 domain-containing protein n=1 Tax=Serinibacter arcticus TaxID=1655435 RepID=UPI002E26CFDA